MSQPSLHFIAPVMAMVTWTFMIGLSLLVVRLPLVIKYNKRLPPGIRGEQLHKYVSPQKQWRADNFNHLHEAPTIFYAVALTLTFLRVSDSPTTALAWLYVALRVVHSLIQVTTNIIVYRFIVFTTSQFILSFLALRALYCILGHNGSEVGF